MTTYQALKLITQWYTTADNTWIYQIPKVYSLLGSHVLNVCMIKTKSLSLNLQSTDDRSLSKSQHVQYFSTQLCFQKLFYIGGHTVFNIYTAHDNLCHCTISRVALHITWTGCKLSLNYRCKSEKLQNGAVYS